MGNALVAEGHFKLLTERSDTTGAFKVQRVRSRGLGDRRGLIQTVPSQETVGCRRVLRATTR